MEPLFSGSIARQRQINLGGSLAGPSSTSQLAAQARSSRQARDVQRRREDSARSIQRVYRGSQVRQGWRQWRRDEFRLLMSEGALQGSAVMEDSARAARATRALIDAVKTKPTSTGRRTASNQSDEELIRQWAIAVAAPVGDGKCSRATGRRCE